MSGSPAQLISVRESTVVRNVAEENDEAELVREIFAALADTLRDFPDVAQLDAPPSAASEVIDISSATIQRPSTTSTNTR